MNDFNDHERSLLAALQEDDSPSDIDASRIKQRVLMGAAVGAGAATATKAAAAASGGGAGASGVATSGVLAGGLWKAVLVVAVTGGFGGAAYSVLGGGGSDREVVAPREDPRTQTPPSHARPEALPPADAVVEQPVVESPEELGLGESESDGETKKLPVQLPPSSGSDAKNAPPSASSLAEEAALLQRAQRALQGGQAQVAITALTEHQQKFPRGTLAGEREAALAVAYCKSGQLSRGRSKAERFIKNQPKSPMVKRLTSACQLTPP